LAYTFCRLAPRVKPIVLRSEATTDGDAQKTPHVNSEVGTSPPGPSERGKGRPRLLIFVIAYQAETTLRAVLERIPPRIFGDLDCEILVVDDASEDRTFDIGCEYRDAHPGMQLTVLRNEFNQGYGGNQKVGYAYAVAQGFDHVAMVHGDGQYAPEALPDLLQPLLAGEADVVFGSRMMTRTGALKGGMPLYKFVGNKILTKMQNALLRSNLSEFHSGYRIYSVDALKRLPFALNSNDFHFDTEIIIQVLNAGLRIKELPIPTYYGDEISRVNGMKYAKDVMVATVKNAFHRSGLLYQRRFDTAPRKPPHDDLKLGYASSHAYAIEAVPHGSTVIDIGSTPDGVAAELVRKGCRVMVVDPEGASVPAPAGVTVHVQDLNAPSTFDVTSFQYLLLLDVIEHLPAPEAFLGDLRRQFGFKPHTLILTTPNVAFIVQRIMLALGQFNYGRSGILDLTHKRLYTFASTKQMLVDAGFRIKEIRGIPAPFPKAIGAGPLARLALAGNQLLIRVSNTLFAYQIYVVAESTPDVSFVLEAARRSERPQLGRK
jgi:glycosyltransferase involved in cell wall biosynthesis/2-polyprenyl-3-methyl-5-hydroxy-6-metoxy-1,4-benzoquinol methylase